MGYEHKERLKELLPEYMDMLVEDEQTVSRGNGYYDCPICRSGAKENGTPAFHIYGQRFTCFACNRHGDIYDLIAEMEGLTEKPWRYHYSRAYKLLKEYLAEDYVRPAELEVNCQTEKQDEDYAEYLLQCHADVCKTKYFDKRGLSDQTVERFKLGYDSGKKAVTIPFNGDFKGYVHRSTRDNDKSYYKHGNELFNKEALYSGDKNYVFVVEGQLDALSFEEVGYPAVGLGGVSEVNRLVEQLKEQPCKKMLILALDNDPAGKRATGKLLQEIAERQVECQFLVDSRFYEKYKDANEFLLADKDEFARRCEIMTGRVQS